MISFLEAGTLPHPLRIFFAATLIRIITCPTAQCIFCIYLPNFPNLWKCSPNINLFESRCCAAAKITVLQGLLLLQGNGFYFKQNLHWHPREVYELPLQMDYIAQGLIKEYRGKGAGGERGVVRENLEWSISSKFVFCISRKKYIHLTLWNEEWQLQYSLLKHSGHKDFFHLGGNSEKHFIFSLS